MAHIARWANNLIEICSEVYYLLSLKKLKIFYFQKSRSVSLLHWQKFFVIRTGKVHWNSKDCVSRCIEAIQELYGGKNFLLLGWGNVRYFRVLIAGKLIKNVLTKPPLTLKVWIAKLSSDYESPVGNCTVFSKGLLFLCRNENSPHLPARATRKQRRRECSDLVFIWANTCPNYQKFGNTKSWMLTGWVANANWRVRAHLSIELLEVLHARYPLVVLFPFKSSFSWDPLAQTFRNFAKVALSFTWLMWDKELAKMCYYYFHVKHSVASSSCIVPVYSCRWEENDIYVDVRAF